MDVLQRLKFDSDHRTVYTTIEVNKKHIRSKKFQHKLPRTASFQQKLFQEELANHIQRLGSNGPLDVHTFYNGIEESIKAAVTKSATNKDEKRRSKLSEETREWLEKREEAEEIRDTNNAFRLQYAEINKMTKRMIRRDLRKHKEETVKQIMANSKSLKKIRQELSSGKPWIQSLTTPLGQIKTSRTDIIQTATDFYANLYKSSTQNANSSLVQFISKPAEEVAPVPPKMRSEVRKALRDLKVQKSPGEDGILNEYLKAGEDELAEPLTDCFNKIILTEEIPESWLTNNIILLHKKGSKDDVNNYRPISLMSTIYKLFSAIITRRINPCLRENQPVEQAGFRAGFSTIDHIQSVAQVMEKAQEYNLDLYMAFIDFAKAFDSVEHVSILTALQNQGVEEKYIRIIAQIYSSMTAKIRLEREGNSFQLRRGVRQGDPISPSLFISLLEDIFRKMTMDWGFQIDGTKLQELRFADDIILFATSAEDLRRGIQEVAQQSRKAGLELNAKKTKLMTNSTEDIIKLDNQELEYVNEYTYLGQTMSFNNATRKEIQRRISAAWSKFWGLKFILTSKAYSIKMKKDIMDSCILPLLLYGAQTWALTSRERRMLQTCQRKMERKILGVTLQDRIRNDDLRKMTNIKDAATSATFTKWKWAGHAMRMDHNRWAHKTTTWDPRIGRRDVGRQRRRWADDLRLNFGRNWTTKAKDRREWRQLTEAAAKHT